MFLDGCAGMCQGASNFSKNYSALDGADAQIGTAIQQLGGPVLSNLVRFPFSPIWR